MPATEFTRAEAGLYGSIIPNAPLFNDSIVTQPMRDFVKHRHDNLTEAGEKLRHPRDVA